MVWHNTLRGIFGVAWIENDCLEYWDSVYSKCILGSQGVGEMSISETDFATRTQVI